MTTSATTTALETELENRAGTIRRDESGRLVVLPPDTAAVAAVLAFCSAEGIKVAAAGSCTWLPHHTDSSIILSVHRLAEVTEHEPADLVIGARAGLALTALQSELRAAGQYVPLDPAAHSTASIGAIVSRRDAGPLRALHGTPRDMTLGVEVVTGDGRVLHFGGRVVKNVAGYDGVRLMVGSAGSLGIITAVYLRVRGLPRADRTVSLACGSAGEAAQLALAIRDRLSPDALELLSPDLMTTVTGVPEWGLLIRVTGNQAGVEEALARIHDVATTAPCDVPEEAWTTLCATESAGHNHSARTGPAGSLSDTLAYGHTQGTRMAAHAADGIVRTWNIDPTETSHVPVEAATDPAAQVIGDRIRAMFDPAGILMAPGAR